MSGNEMLFLYIHQLLETSGSVGPSFPLVTLSLSDGKRGRVVENRVIVIVVVYRRWPNQLEVNTLSTGEGNYLCSIESQGLLVLVLNLSRVWLISRYIYHLRSTLVAQGAEYTGNNNLIYHRILLVIGFVKMLVLQSYMFGNSCNFMDDIAGYF